MVRPRHVPPVVGRRVHVRGDRLPGRASRCPSSRVTERCCASGTAPRRSCSRAWFSTGGPQGHPGQPFFTVLFGLLIPFAGVAAQTYRLRHATDPVVRQQSRLLRWALLPMFFAGALYLVLTSVIDGAWIEDIGLAVFPALFALVPDRARHGHPALPPVGHRRAHQPDAAVGRTRRVHRLRVRRRRRAASVTASGPAGRPDSRFSPRPSSHWRSSRCASDSIGSPIGSCTANARRRTRSWPNSATGSPARSRSTEILPRIAEAAVKAVGGSGRPGHCVPARRRQPNGRVAAGERADIVSVRHARDVPRRTRRRDRGRDRCTVCGCDRKRKRCSARSRPRPDWPSTTLAMAIELQARLEELSRQAAELRCIAPAHRDGARGAAAAGGAAHPRSGRSAHAPRRGRVVAARRGVRRRPRAVWSSASTRCSSNVARRSTRCESSRAASFPAILADQGLVNALGAYILQAPLPIDVELDAIHAADRYDAQAEATVYFCVIQALANAGTYASGSNVAARVRVDGGKLKFSIADDGPGVDPRAIAAGRRRQ